MTANKVKSKKYHARVKNPSKVITTLLWTGAITVAGVMVAFYVSQLIIISNNRVEFASFQKMLDEIQADDSFTVPGAKWEQIESCVATPFTEFELTIGARKEWICSVGIRRPVGVSENPEITQTRLVSIVKERFDISRSYNSGNGLIMDTSEGISCAVSLGLKEEYGERGGIMIGCSDGAYKPWYSER